MVIWKWPVLERVKLFLWKAMNRSLFTNAERTTRHMSTSDLCPICGGEAESLFHVFRDCNRIRMLWKCLKIPNIGGFYSSSNLCDWLEKNLCSNHEIDNMNWNITFATILDSVWMLAMMVFSTAREPTSDLFSSVLKVCQTRLGRTKL